MGKTKNEIVQGLTGRYGNDFEFLNRVLWAGEHFQLTQAGCAMLSCVEKAYTIQIDYPVYSNSILNLVRHIKAPWYLSNRYFMTFDEKVYIQLALRDNDINLYAKSLAF